MKKICAALACMLLLSVSLTFAQESKLYARSFNIERVFVHAKGYKVTYITGTMKYTATYLPHKWFSQAASSDGSHAKGQVAYGNDPSYPYMTVFWKEGKFSHVRLYLKSDVNDISYGTISPKQDPAAFDVEEPHLEY